MAQLPDPTGSLQGRDREIFDHMASARAQAEGRAHLGEVYVRMFNNPGAAAKVGALGEHLRFHGTLPDEVRELVILRFAARQGFGYEWAHHQRPARRAGLTDEVIAELTAGKIPKSLSAAGQTVLQIVDEVVAKRSVPDALQEKCVDAYGYDGMVEVVLLCGLYATMGYMTTAFDIAVEAGLPAAPF